MRKASTLLALLTLSSVGCTDPGCGNEESARVPSPSGRLEAVVFSRNCGATTGFNTQVSIVAAGKSADGPGNVLVADGTVPLKLAWPAETALSISGVGQAKLFSTHPQVAGVTIAYVR